jgi:hypothetical protein
MGRLKKSNTVVYGYASMLADTFYELFASEHRMWVKEPVNQKAVTGLNSFHMSEEGRKLAFHPSIRFSQYKPVHNAIIGKIQKEYFLDLMKECDGQSVRVLVLPPANAEMKELLKKDYPKLDITFVETNMPDTTDGLYLIKEIKLRSSDTVAYKYWTQFLGAVLPFCQYREVTNET